MTQYTYDVIVFSGLFRQIKGVWDLSMRLGNTCQIKAFLFMLIGEIFDVITSCNWKDLAATKSH